MNNPKISVIIPCYNVQDYLSECLDSVFNQTFKDFEVISFVRYFLLDIGSKIV